jgi:hypothetical protein
MEDQRAAWGWLPTPTLVFLFRRHLRYKKTRKIRSEGTAIGSGWINGAHNQPGASGLPEPNLALITQMPIWLPMESMRENIQ